MLNPDHTLAHNASLQIKGSRLYYLDFAISLQIYGQCSELQELPLFPLNIQASKSQVLFNFS